MSEHTDPTQPADQPPPEYHPSHGTPEADITRVGHVYPAVLSAHFPDAASADRAIEGLQRFPLTGNPPIQRFEKEPPESKYDENDPGLEPGEVALVVHFADESQATEAVRVCEEAGAKHARFYPAQRIGDAEAPDPDAPDSGA